MPQPPGHSSGQKYTSSGAQGGGVQTARGVSVDEMDVSVGLLVELSGGGNVRVGGKVATGVSESMRIREQPARRTVSVKTSNRMVKYARYMWIDKQVFFVIKCFLFGERGSSVCSKKERAKPEAPPLFSIVEELIRLGTRLQ